MAYDPVLEITSIQATGQVGIVKDLCQRRILSADGNIIKRYRLVTAITLVTVEVYDDVIAAIAIVSSTTLNTRSTPKAIVLI